MPSLYIAARTTGRSGCVKGTVAKSAMAAQLVGRLSGCDIGIRANLSLPALPVESVSGSRTGMLINSPMPALLIASCNGCAIWKHYKLAPAVL